MSLWTILYYIAAIAVIAALLYRLRIERQAATFSRQINLSIQDFRRLHQAGIWGGSVEEVAVAFFGKRDKWPKVNKGAKDGPTMRIGNVLRWFTPVGITATQAVENFIRQSSTLAIQTQQQAFANGQPTFFRLPVVLQTLTFTHNNTAIPIANFQDIQDIGMKTTGSLNLCGIHLHDLQFSNLQLAGVTFSGGQLDKCVISDTEFVSCSFPSVKFKNTKFAHNAFPVSNLGHSRFERCYFNRMAFDDQSMAISPKVDKIGYLQLLFFIVQAFVHRDGRYFNNKGWSDFVFNDVNGLTKAENSEFRAYVNWYQNYIDEVRNIRSLPISRAAILFTEAAISKFWTSFMVFASFVASLILSFSILFYFLRDKLGKGPYEYFDALEFSFKNFLNAGYSPINPESYLIRGLSIVETTLGYVLLATLIYLLNKKLERRNDR